MQPGQNKYENYTCGPETDFEWTPFDWCPKCVDSGNVCYFTFNVIEPLQLFSFFIILYSNRIV